MYLRSRIRVTVAAATLAGTVSLAGLVPQTARAVPPSSVPQVGQVAVVDLQAILERTKHGRRSRAKLERAVKDKQTALDRERARLEAEVARLGKLAGRARAELQQKLAQESAKWQQDAMGFEMEMARMENEMLEEIYANVSAIVERLARERHLDLVLVKDQMTVVYVAPSLDLTDEVVSRYDKVHK